MNTREDIVIAGIEVAAEVFRHSVPDAKVKTLIKDGTLAKKGTPLMRITGPGRGLLTAERTSLNILQFMCGIATLVREYVSQIEHTAAQLIDTRKPFRVFACCPNIGLRRRLSAASPGPATA